MSGCNGLSCKREPFLDRRNDAIDLVKADEVQVYRYDGWRVELDRHFSVNSLGYL